MKQKRLLVGISGASGMPIAVELLVAYFLVFGSAKML